MLPQIDRYSPVPIYQQVKDWMRENILSGDWAEHYQLQAEDDLAQALNINRGTVRNAIKSLMDEGLLVRIHGKGTFVASRKVEQPLAESLMTFSESLIQQNIAYTTTVLQQQVIAADDDLSALFQIGANASLLFLQRVRRVEGTPIIFFANYVSMAHFPNIEAQDFANRRLFDVIEHDYGFKISWAKRYFEARIADAEVATALELAEGSPVMYAKQITYSQQDVPIEVSNIWLRGESFRLSATVLRGAALSLLNGAPEMVQSEILV